ncbi:hypothetical protein MHU86_9735 [Fragilaria crotonensis]|nr:hypothetical protein MHU86_9735 [Fragilaria crotonensis]
MIQQDNTTTKHNAVLIEPDMNEQPPCKKLKTCAQNDLAEALLDLRKCTSSRGNLSSVLHYRYPMVLLEEALSSCRVMIQHLSQMMKKIHLQSRLSVARRRQIKEQIRNHRKAFIKFQSAVLPRASN